MLNLALIKYFPFCFNPPITPPFNIPERVVLFKKNVENIYFNKIQIHAEVFKVDIVDGPKRIF